MPDSPYIGNRLYGALEAAYGHADDKLAFIEAVRDWLSEHSPQAHQPVDRVKWVEAGKVKPNAYNPNAVAHAEMKLLKTSIDHDGYTQPIVTMHNPDDDTYEIVDGFHRYFVARTSPDLLLRLGYRLPVVVIDKPLADRMASTVRHNRARGRHTVSGMSTLVFGMLDSGMSDEDVCNELGMEPEELLRLKHITGFSKLFADSDYRRAWVTRRQMAARNSEASRDGP